jgi:uncharacterized protein (DUF2235 family)
MQTSPRQPGKNIVLLSDGTGNSSAKLMKTNVWRMYEALDLTTGDQVAMYDNGVGTSGFKPFAVLGGALGWGLKRNVRNLYMFACRNYQAATAGHEADRLYAFGFSRGAFTARVLIGLIESQGLVAGVRGKDLERHAKWAYREYRRQFNATRGLVTPLRKIRDVALRSWERIRGLAPYDASQHHRVRVAFLGLWDMVDAYGLPIDEMTRGWDQWVWPLSMRAHLCPAKVDKICHAVALDDERHTFHPVLLDEAGASPSHHIDEERLTQVWFAGVHSNVGGGYPDDSLARVSLRWMGTEAEKQGLRLHPFVRAEWEARADPYGPANDSRRGLGAYYRYNPRSIQKLTNDRFADVTVPLPKIHESVFQRIGTARDEYAPIVLPETYAIVRRDGSVVSGNANPYEHPTQSQSRCADQERVWNWVWARRVLYFSTVALTVLLIAQPLVMTPNESWLPSPRSRALSGVVGLAGEALPGPLQLVTQYYEQHPVQFIVLSGSIIGLMILSSWVQGTAGDRMRRYWDAILHAGPVKVTPSPEPRDLVYRLRSHPLYRNTLEFMSQRVLPLLFGVGALLIVAVVAVATINRAAFAARGATGETCVPWEAPRPPADSFTVPLPSDELCYATGITLEAGTRYIVNVSLPRGGWFDASRQVTRLSGFSSLERSENTNERQLIYLLALPFRRVLTAQWFVPIARIGALGAEYHTLDRENVEIVPRQSSQLFLFVNDAIGVPPFRTWNYFYTSNNVGSAEVTVRRAAPN